MVYLSPSIISELGKIAEHLQLEARASRFVTSVRLAAPEASEHSVKSYIKEAKGVGVNLWMCRPTFTPPKNTAVLCRLAHCYDATAAAITLLLDAFKLNLNNSVSVEDCLAALAQAMVYLRLTVSQVSTACDKEQLALHKLLRQIGGTASLYLPLRNVDCLPPTAEEIAALKDKIVEMQERLAKGQFYDKQLGILRQQLDAMPTDVTQWIVVSKQVSRLVKNGMKASSTLIRDILLPVFESIPASDRYDAHFQAVIHAIDDYLESRPDIDHSLNQEQPTEDVVAVRRMLEGRKLILIGGRCRKASQQKIEKAFALDELIWLSTKPHESVYNFKSTVQGTGVGAVLLAIRFASHTFGEIKEFCKEAGVPFVRLPAGYNANQVAHQILGSP